MSALNIKADIIGIVIRNTQTVLRRFVFLLGGQAEPVHRLLVILLDTLAKVIRSTKL